MRLFKRLFKHLSALLLFRHLAALLAVLVFTILLKWLQPYLAIQLIALIFLLPVLASTVLWGLTPGVLAGFVGFLAFNYYFIQPYHTLQVHQSQDVITLVVFLIVAVVTSQLIGRAREGEHLARKREWEATRMYELISVLAGLQDAQSIARALATHLLETFHFERVEVTMPGRNDTAASAGSNLQEPPHERIPLITTRGREGELRIWQRRGALSSEEARLLEAYTGQGALALERIRLSSLENKARVLEESDRLKSSLLNSVSHELRSPLAAIKASVSSLRSGAVDWDTTARQELLATIEEETDHLNLLVGNLLDMSRIEVGGAKTAAALERPSPKSPWAWPPKCAITCKIHAGNGIPGKPAPGAHRLRDDRAGIHQPDQQQRQICPAWDRHYHHRLQRKRSSARAGDQPGAAGARTSTWSASSTNSTASPRPTGSPAPGWAFDLQRHHRGARRQDLG